MKIGDLVRWAAGPNWTEEQKIKSLALGLVMCIFDVNDKVGVQWCSHDRTDFNVYDKEHLEMISESR